jgi:hypothetical protein
MRLCCNFGIFHCSRWQTAHKMSRACAAHNSTFVDDRATTIRYSRRTASWGDPAGAGAGHGPRLGLSGERGVSEATFGTGCTCALVGISLVRAVCGCCREGCACRLSVRCAAVSRAVCGRFAREVSFRYELLSKLSYSLYRGFVLLPSEIVLLDLLLGGTFGLRRWPTPLGPPTDLMPGHLSPARGLTTLNDTHLRDGQSR